MYAPRMYMRYGKTLDALLARDPAMRRNFKNNNFAAMTMNLGPNTVTFRHVDHLNVPWGWCAITALGNYDPKLGGHLVLWDLGIAIEFPPGATILIPSSAIHHSNTRIRAGEKRYSFTQYSSGGLFRWAYNGFMTAEQRRRKMTQDELSTVLEELSSQLDFGLSLYSTVDEIKNLRGITIAEGESNKVE